MSVSNRARWLRRAKICYETDLEDRNLKRQH